MVSNIQVHDFFSIAGRFKLTSPAFTGSSENPPSASAVSDQKKDKTKSRITFRTLLKGLAFFTVMGASLAIDYGYHVLRKDPVQLVQSVCRNTRPIPQEIVTHLKPFFDHAPHPIDFEHLQVIPEVLPFFQGKDHVLPGFHGTVVLSKNDYQDFTTFEQLSPYRKRSLTIMFAHELAHLVQMQLLGRNDFLDRIAQESLVYPNVYETNMAIYRQVSREKEAKNILNDPTLFVHPHLTLEQCAVMVEQFIANRMPES